MKKFILLSISFLFPIIVFGQAASNSTLDTLLQKIDEVIVNPLIFLMFGAALVVFLWGVIQFVAAADNEEGRKTGKSHILWGIIGMFIMVSAFGIINIIVNTFGIDNSAINAIKK